MTEADSVIPTLVDTFKTTVQDLYYSSESDYPFAVFALQCDISTPLSPNTLLKHLGKPQNSTIDEQPVDQFFSRLTQIKPWYGNQEIAIANRFQTLADLVHNTLVNPTVYRIGTVEIDIYIVGLVEPVEQAIAPTDKQTWMVISTKAVET
jgi:hypothetical protein